MSKGFLAGRLLTGRLMRGDGEDYSRVIKLFLYLFCVVSASTIGRTAADTLFLSHYPSSTLSLMYLPQAAALIATGILFQRYGSRLRIDTLCKLVIVGVAALSLLSRVLVGFGFHWVYPVIYIGFDIINFLMIVCFWQFATSVIDQRKAKKQINWVASGGIAGGIVSGFGLKALAMPLGTANLIFLYAGFQLLCLLLVTSVVKRLDSPIEKPSAVKSNDRKHVKKAASGATGGKEKNKEGLFGSVPHLKYVAFIAAAITISLTFADYQFKVILRETLQNEALAGFMGSFYGYAGLVALLVQFFATGRVISKFGVMTALLLFPVCLFAGSLGVLLAPVLAFATIVKGSDKVVGDTIYSTASQLVMFPVSPEFRGRAKAFLDGIVRNGAKGLAAISLIVLSPLMPVRLFSVIILALLACGMIAVVKIKGAYMNMLLSTLQTRNVDLQDAELDVMDAVSQKVLTDALQHPDKVQALYALRILKGLTGFQLNPHLAGLLQHPAIEVRIEALRHIQETRPDAFIEALEPQLSSPDARLRAQAIVALAAYGQDARLERLTAYLEDDEVVIKAAAIAGLIKYYGVEGMFRAVGTFKELIASVAVEDRMAMASLFGQIGIPGFYKPIVPLLQDASPEVRLRALESAAVLRVPELVPHIVPLLGHGGTRQQAADALARYEEQTVIPLLLPYLAISGPALHVPGVFERIGTQAAFDSLLDRYAHSSYDLRAAILESLSRMKQEGRAADPRSVEGLIDEECGLYAQLGGLVGGTLLPDGQAAQGSAELREAVRHMHQSAAARIFQLLGLLTDPATMQAVYANWTNGDARRQANAAEVVEQLLHGELRSRIASLMAASSGRSSGTADGQAADTGSRLSLLYDLGDEWLQACVAAMAISQELRAPELSVRLEREWPAAGRTDLLKRMEQVRLLREVAIFAGLSGKELSAIAEQLADEDAGSGTAIIQEGDEGDALYLIREGTAEIVHNGRTVNTLRVGDCFGEMSVLTGGKRTASVIAGENMRLWRLDSAAFYEIAFDKTAIALAMMKLLSHRLRDSIAKHGSGAASAASAQSQSPLEAAAAHAFEEEADRHAGHAAQDELADNRMLLRRMLVLQQIGLFANFAQDDFVRLAKMVKEVVYQPGEPICIEGEDGDTMHGIIEGSVRVHRGSQTLATLGVGECFGEMALIDGEPRSADCSAVERTVLLQLSREQLFVFCFQRIEVMRGMMRVLAERLKSLQSL